jgi:hypothetical protein
MFISAILAASDMPEHMEASRLSIPVSQSQSFAALKKAAHPLPKYEAVWCNADELR